MVHSKYIQWLIALVVLCAAVAGSFAATSLFQRTVPIVPGMQGCWRLEGSARQVDCLSDEFVSGANKVAGSSTGAARDRKVISYVRRAEKLAADDPRLAAECHPAMHQLGRDEGARAAKDGRAPQFPGGSSQLCTAGYVHGLAEGYLATNPTADVAAVYPKLCYDPKAASGCAHGVGHALLRARTNIGSTKATHDAIARCDELPATPATSCHNGVFMELAMRTKPEPVSVDDFAASCTKAYDSDPVLGLSCWNYLDLSFASNDVPETAVPTWCGHAPVPAQFPCIEGYGRALGTTKVSECGAKSVGRTALKQRCIDGALVLQVGSGHVSRRQARIACSTLDRAALESYCDTAVDRFERVRAKQDAEPA